MFIATVTQINVITVVIYKNLKKM